MQNNVDNATNNGGEAIKLLELSSSDSLESPNFSHFPAPKPKRKVRFKKAFRPNSKMKMTSSHVSRNCNCHLADAARILVCFLLLALIFALVWHVINLSTRIQELQKRFNSIEATNKNTPEELHTIHSKLKDLDANVTALFLDIRKNSVDIENATAEIKQLKETTNGLQDSIAAASTIKQLPKDVSSLSQSVVTFGSKIGTVENTVKELRESQASVQSTTQNLSFELESIKATLQNLSSVNKLSSTETSPSIEDPSAMRETEQRIARLQQGLLDFTSSMEKLNSSVVNQLFLLRDLPDEISFLNKSVYIQQEELHAIYSNVTFRVEHLEAECLKPTQYSNMSEIMNLVNKTVTKAVVNMVQSNSSFDEGSLRLSSKSVIGAHNGLVLLAELLKQFGPISSQEWTNATVVTRLLNDSFHELMKERGFKTQESQTVHEQSAQFPITQSSTAANESHPGTILPIS